MRLFIDANILLDVLLARTPHLKAAQTIWSLVEAGSHKAGISAISFNNVYYIVRKLGTRQKAKLAISTLLDLFDVVAVDRDILKKAKDSDFPDYEDAIQWHCAQDYRAAVLISRNAKDFPSSSVPILSGEEFLARQAASE